MTARTLNPTILREYDIRGIVGETLGPEDLLAIGHAFGTRVRLAGGARVAVGRDGRLSSPELEAAAVEGLGRAGVSVERIGLGPTPMLYYAVHELAADGGLMVTGSHNPPSHNGCKLMLGRKPFFGADIQALGAAAAQETAYAGHGAVREVAVLERYVARIARDHDGGRPLKVAWDAGNGAAGEALQKLVARLPGRHILLNETIDGTFPAHHPDPTVPENLEQLRAAVLAEGCDLGIAFDGDGDRIGILDGAGRILWGDQIVALLARDVLAASPGATIIADVKASQSLFDEIARLGGRPLMWKTGHSLIKQKMAEERSPLAGEMSGHIFFADRYYGFDDALYVAVRMLNLVSGSQTSLAALRDSLPAAVNTPEMRFDCAEDRKFKVVEEVRGRLSAAGATVDAVDGVRVRNEDGWWLLRASNTQAVLVARCEAASEAGLGRLKAALGRQLAESGIDLPVM